MNGTENKEARHDYAALFDCLQIGCPEMGKLSVFYIHPHCEPSCIIRNSKKKKRSEYL